MSKKIKTNPILLAVHVFYPELLSQSEKEYIEAFQLEFNPLGDDKFLLDMMGPLKSRDFQDRSDEIIRGVHELFLQEEALILFGRDALLK